MKISECLKVSEAKPFHLNYKGVDIYYRDFDIAYHSGDDGDYVLISLRRSIMMTRLPSSSINEFHQYIEMLAAMQTLEDKILTLTSEDK